MKIIVDTNVIFSAILSPSGKIGQILIYGRKQFEFYAPNLVKIEVKRHRDKIIQMGELTDTDFEDTRDDIFDCLNFISEEQIPYEYWQEAIPLVRDTDMDDIAFVVLSEYLDAQLWTVREFHWKAEVKESDRKVYKLTIKDNPDNIQTDGTHKRTRRR